MHSLKGRGKKAGGCTAGEHLVRLAGNSINAGSFCVTIKRVLRVAVVLEIRLQSLRRLDEANEGGWQLLV